MQLSNFQKRKIQKKKRNSFNKVFSQCLYDDDYFDDIKDVELVESTNNFIIFDGMEPDTENILLISKNQDYFSIRAIIDTGAFLKENLIDLRFAQSLGFKFKRNWKKFRDFSGTKIEGRICQGILVFREHQMNVNFLAVENLENDLSYKVLIGKPTLLNYSLSTGKNGKISLDLVDYNDNNKKNENPRVLMVRRLNIEEMNELAKDKGGKCLSEEYINSKIKLTWKCQKGHVWEATPNMVKNGRWCPKCAGNIRLNIEDMKRLAKKRGGKCLSKQFINENAKLKWQCKMGHKWKASPKTVKRGHWCKKCAISSRKRNNYGKFV